MSGRIEMFFVSVSEDPPHYYLSYRNFSSNKVAIKIVAGLVGHYTVGHRDVCGLSATDPCLRQWISFRTMPKYVGMPLWLVLVTTPHMSVRGDNTLQHQVVMTAYRSLTSPTGAVASSSPDKDGLKVVQTMFSGVALTPKRLSNRPSQHHWWPFSPEL